MPSDKKRWFPYAQALLLGLLVSFFLVVGCHKKDRLTASTFRFSITPPAATVLQTATLTLVAKGTSPGGPVDVNPTWSISPSTPTNMLTPTIGPSVTFQPSGLGDYVITAVYDGMVATSQIAVVSYIPSPATYSVYSDNGLPQNSSLFTGGGISIDATMSTGYTPEGIHYARSSNTTSSQFWGISLSPVADLSAYSFLKFDLRLGRTMGSSEILNIRIQDHSTTFSHPLVDGSDGFSRLNTQWQEISIPIASFGGVDKHQIVAPFILLVQTVTSPLTFDIDAIRWSN